MAKKKCPKCQQTLPVACKSCPCGHIFIAKKCSTSKDPDVKKSNASVSVTRLRPERPKREIPDYEYRDDYTRISVGNGDTQLKTISKKMKLIGEDDYADDDVFIDGKAAFERSDSVDPQTGPIRRKRGRPKGSKNKQKDDQNFMADLSEDNDDSAERKSGKVKNTKKKLCELPPIPENKVRIYSLILSDINERFVSQNKIKCLPGL